MKLRFNSAHTILHEEEDFAIASQEIELHFKALSPGLHSCLRALQEGCKEESLTDLALKRAGVEGLYQLHQILEQFKTHSMLTYMICSDGGPLLTLTPTNSSFRWLESESTANYVLSRFCLLHRVGEEWILETPLSAARIAIHDPVILSVIHALMVPRKFTDLEAPLEPSVLHKCCQILVAAQILVSAGSEDNNPTLGVWEFHDLLFHARSRMGRHDQPTGGTFPFQDKWPHPPVCKPLGLAERIMLPQPDLEELRKTDPRFTEVLEGRKSVRSAGDAPITFAQLGEFLFRAARLKEHMPNGAYASSRRPSPGGGAMHELELYLVVRECNDLSSGVYHYDPEGHALCAVAAFDARANMLIESAYASNGRNVVPQILIVVTARFQRMMWKYRSMAYATILKDAGALLQTMYLVATAMRLAPCALGGGNADLFAELIGSNYYEETSVAEFMLSSNLHLK